MAEIETDWTYDLSDVTEDKRTAKPAVAKGAAFELIGVDGNYEGALRPFPGFLKVLDLDGFADSNHDSTSRVIDWQPVNFQVGSEGYAYGVVYRVRRKAIGGGIVAAADVFMTYWNSRSMTWTKHLKVMDTCSTIPQFDCRTWGRFVFVFVSGRSPSVTYLTPTTPWTPVVLGLTTSGSQPGPGLRPSLLDADKAGALGSIITTGDANRPGAGQIFLTDTPPTGVGLGLGTGGVGGTPQPGGTGLDDGQNDGEATLLRPGDYAFAYMLQDSKTGRRSCLSDVAQARSADFSTGSSSPSLYAAIEITYDQEKFDQALIFRSVMVQDAGGTFIAGLLFLDQIIDLGQYPTNNNPLADTALAQSVYYYEVPDLGLVQQPTYLDRPLFDEFMPFGGAGWFYDNTLLVSKIGTPGNSTGDQITGSDASRGLGELRWSSVVDGSPELFPPQNRKVPITPSDDVIAFRNAGENVIGFAADRQYVIRREGTYLVPKDIHEGFGLVGPKALDSVASMIYFLSQKGLKTVDSQTQLEDVRSINEIVLREWTAAELERVQVVFDSVLSALFVINPAKQHAAVLWYNTAKVTELYDFSFQHTGRGVWPVIQPDGTFAAGGTLVPRALFFQGWVADNEVTPHTEFNGSLGRIFIVDDRRTKTNSQTDDARITMGDFFGDAFFNLPDGASAGDPNFALDIEGNALILDGPLALSGAWVYVTDCSEANLIGEKVQVMFSTSSGMDGVYDGLRLVTGRDLPKDTRICISPVYFRWVGYPLAIQADNGTPFALPKDYFRVRGMDSMAAYFFGCGGSTLQDPLAPTDAKWKGLVYRGQDTAPRSASFPRGTSGDVVQSVKDGASNDYAAFGKDATKTTSLGGKYGYDGQTLNPGLEIVVSDLDFALVSVKVRGDVKDTSRTERASA